MRYRLTIDFDHHDMGGLAEWGPEGAVFIDSYVKRLKDGEVASLTLEEVYNPCLLERAIVDTVPIEDVKPGEYEGSMSILRGAFGDFVEEL